jgi:hypothetical protein
MTGTAKTKKAPSLPGDCLPIPQVMAKIRDAHGQVQRVVETHVVPDLDLDGHGSPVVMVPPDHLNISQSGMWWRLFIQRGDCGYELGIVIGMDDPIPEPGESHGLRNFSVMESVPVGGEQGIGLTTYVFDGERYKGGRTEYR